MLASTSREPLRTAEEIAWQVPSLPLDDEAIESFTDRAVPHPPAQWARHPGGMIRKNAQAFGFALVRLRSHGHESRVDVFEPRSGFSCLTSVVRVPAQLGAAALQAIRTVPGLEEHYVYPASDLHLTVANLDRSPLAEPRLVDACARAVAGSEPFEVELRGIAMTAQSVYAQAWDSSGALWRLRAAIAEAAGVRLPVPRRLLGFVNLVRFANPSIRPVREGVERLRDARVGSLAVDTVELVRTDKVLSVDGTHVLRRAALRGVRGSEFTATREEGIDGC